MTGRGIAVLSLVCLIAVGCGPERGLRVEHVTGHAASASGSLHIVSGTTVQGLPYTLVPDGATIWVSILNPRATGIQPISSRTAETGGFILQPFRTDLPLAIAITRGRLWMLAQPPQGHARLFDVKTHEQSALRIAHSAGLGWFPRGLRRRAMAFPHGTKIAGSTASALWLRTDAGSAHILWRLDAYTADLSRFVLHSYGTPGIAVTPHGVYVLLRTRDTPIVVIQKRNAAGAVIRQSPPFRLRGALQPMPLAACQDQIYGWALTEQGAELFRVEAHGNGATYSQTLPPRPNAANPPKVTAMALDDGCRNVWIGTVRNAAGIVLRLRSSSLAVTGRVNTAYVRALLWQRGSLWASDLLHQAVLRIG